MDGRLAWQVAYKMNSGENACDTNELLGER